MSADASLVVPPRAAERINRVAWLCPAVLLLEGYDIAAIGFAIPSLVDVWHIQPAAITRVLTAGNFGLMLGSLASGLLGDRVGRKPVLLSCVFLFGAFSLMSAFAASPSSLAVLRFLTGLGLGGGLPTVLALACDVALPISQQRFVILINVAVPIGFSAGSLLASWLVRAFGWPAIFVVGGMLPIGLLPLLALYLSESIAVHAASNRQSLAVLFRDGLALRTLLLWGTNILSFLSVYFILLWTPALLHTAGLSAGRAILGTMMYGFGVITCPLLTAVIADRFGIERVLTCGLIFGAFGVLSIGLLQPSFWLLSLLLCCAGIAGGCQGGINSLSALSYPHFIRSTSAGWALGVGRIGTIAGPLLGGFLLSVGVHPKSVYIAASIPVGTAALLMAALGRLRNRP